jgi:plasmid replication initiation protein
MSKPLLPNRHPDKDFFICDFGEVIPKSDMASMEHPLFTLSTKPDTAIRNYEHNGTTVTITPSVLGLATIHDKDVLIYCISRLMEGLNKGEEVSRTVRFKAHDLLVTTNRSTGGDGYKRFKNALDRLQGTVINTNIETNGQTVTSGFGIIDGYEIIHENPETKRMVEMEITLSKWLYNSILGQEVLNINRDYFRLRKPIERRIYEIARKHCGSQKEWQIAIHNLHKKVGSSSSLKKFRELLNHIIHHDHLPDYSVNIEKRNVVFRFNGAAAVTKKPDDAPTLRTSTIEKAKEILGRSYDVYAMQSEWIEYWKATGSPALDKPDGAFIGFCKYKKAQFDK